MTLFRRVKMAFWLVVKPYVYTPHRDAAGKFARRPVALKPAAKVSRRTMLINARFK